MRFKTQNVFSFGFSLIIFISCTNGNYNDNDTGPAPFPQPKTYPINTDGGYITNTLTGDTIQPLINSLGILLYR
ncbi:MAG: hypothetical protein IPM74_18965 [Crocinitomicaceae bacterium]|nr:hypothetical protein [Crocinitomicaceae bacterium]